MGPLCGRACLITCALAPARALDGDQLSKPGGGGCIRGEQGGEAYLVSSQQEVQTSTLLYNFLEISYMAAFFHTGALDLCETEALDH